MNRQRVTLLVLLDLSAAFHTVDHGILLDRLYTDFGISGNVHSWFTSYLHDRFQSISINRETSRWFEVKYGVPQGSCLGPLLFTLYASKLFTIIERHLPDVIMNQILFITLPYIVCCVFEIDKHLKTFDKPGKKPR